MIPSCPWTHGFHWFSHLPTTARSVSLPQVALTNKTSKRERLATSGGWAHLVSDASTTFTFLSSTQRGSQESLQSQTNGFQLKFL